MACANVGVKSKPRIFSTAAAETIVYVIQQAHAMHQNLHNKLIFHNHAALTKEAYGTGKSHASPSVQLFRLSRLARTNAIISRQYKAGYCPP